MDHQSSSVAQIRSAEQGVYLVLAYRFLAVAEIVQIIRDVVRSRVEELGKMELEETKIGRLDHKYDKLELIITHCDPAVNLYDQYHCIRGDRLEAVWDITGRGKCQ